MAESFADALTPEDVDGVPVVPWFRAIEADGELAGFVMLAERTAAHPEAYLWRLLIDRRHQRRGIGDRVLALLTDRLRAEGHGRCSSAGTPAPADPSRSTSPRGFVPTGRVDRRRDRGPPHAVTGGAVSPTTATSAPRPWRRGRRHPSAAAGGTARTWPTSAARAPVRRRVAGVVDHGAAADADPPQLRPVLVVVVEQHRRRARRRDVVEAAQLPGPLRLVVDGADDPAVDDGEADRHESHRAGARRRCRAGPTRASAIAVATQSSTPSIRPRRRFWRVPTRRHSGTADRIDAE